MISEWSDGERGMIARTRCVTSDRLVKFAPILFLIYHRPTGLRL